MRVGIQPPSQIWLTRRQAPRPAPCGCRTGKIQCRVQLSKQVGVEQFINRSKIVVAVLGSLDNIHPIHLILSGVLSHPGHSRPQAI